MGETSDDGNSAGDESFRSQPSSKYTALPPLEAITEDDEVQEQKEAREQVSSLLGITPAEHADSGKALEVSGFSDLLNIST